MRLRSVSLLAFAGFGTWGALRAQRPFIPYQGVEYENFPLPPDYQEKTEWTRARLRYPAFINVSHGDRRRRTRAGPSIIPAPTGICCKAFAG